MDDSFRYNMISIKSHWLIQRITAIMLIPLSLWFLYQLVKLSSYNHNDLILFFSSTANSFLFLIMIITSILHGKFGIQTIIEDYAHTFNRRNITINIINILSYILIAISILSIIVIQFSY